MIPLSVAGMVIKHLALQEHSASRKMGHSAKTKRRPKQTLITKISQIVRFRQPAAIRLF